MDKKDYSHDSVLLEETLDGLALGEGKVIVDGTLGLGGHAGKILERIGGTGKLIGFDCDETHIEIAKANLKRFEKNIIFVRSNFAHLQSELDGHGVDSIDGILLDLGIASPHVDDSGRGFSFRADGPLDMRLDRSQALSAKDIVNKWSHEDLTKIFREYGEERYAPKIARAIIERREEKPIETTADLAEIVMSQVYKKDRIHPATRIFQALRIAVNDELNALESALEQAAEVMNEGGRMVVISYHSLEDRIVKRIFKKLSKPKTQETMFSANDVIEPAKFRLITKKPIVPTDYEVADNSRSRSAKLRIIEKIIS